MSDKHTKGQARHGDEPAARGWNPLGPDKPARMRLADLKAKPGPGREEALKEVFLSSTEGASSSPPAAAGTRAPTTPPPTPARSASAAPRAARPGPLGSLGARVPLLVVHATIAGVVVALLTLLRSPRYMAEASLLVNLGREFIYRPVTGEEGWSNMYRLQEMINSQAEILKSRELAGSVASELSVERLYPDIAESSDTADMALTKATQALREGTEVRTIPESSVIRVSLVHEDPSLAALALNVYLDFYQQKHLEVFASSDAALLEKSAGEFRSEWQARKNALTEFRERERIFDPTQQARALLDERGNAAAALREARTRMLEIESALATPAAAADAAAQPQEGGQGLFGLLAMHPSRAIDDALAEHLRLRLAERAALENYAPSSRRITSLRSEAESVEAVLRASLVDELAGLRLRDQAQTKHLDLIDDALARLTRLEAEASELEHEVTTSEAQLRAASSALLESQLSQQLDEDGMASIRILDHASIPLDPLGMSALMRIVLGALGGLALGVSVVLLQRSMGGARDDDAGARLRA